MTSEPGKRAADSSGSLEQHVPPANPQETQPLQRASQAHLETAAFDVHALGGQTKADSASASGKQSGSKAGGSQSGGSQPSRSQAGQMSAGAESLPESIGRFRIEKLLGRGGMGSVYLARDTQLDRPVALKIPRIDGASSNLMQRFTREARAAATLSHPNICPVYDVGQVAGPDGDIHYIAMGYVEGKPLTEYVAAKKRQPERQVAMAVRKIALALDEAHERGIIHRDLKPANIMIDRRGEPIVMDFGLACRLDESSTRLTQEGSVIGTPSYMSPEQIDGRATIGPASDIYSLGVVLYEMLAGKCPFTGTVVSVIGQVLHNEPPPVRELRPDVSPALAAICHRALAKNPADRFPSMKEFARELTNFLKGDASSTQSGALSGATTPLGSASLPSLDGLDALLAATPTTSAGSLAAPLAPYPQRSSPKLLWILGGVAAAVLVVLALVIVLSGGDSPSEQPPLIVSAGGGDRRTEQASTNAGTRSQPTVEQGKPTTTKQPETEKATSSKPQSKPSASESEPSSDDPFDNEVTPIAPTSERENEPAPDESASDEPMNDAPAEEPAPTNRPEATPEKSASESIVSPGEETSSASPPPKPPGDGPPVDGPPGERRPPGRFVPGEQGNLPAAPKSVEELEAQFTQFDHNQDGELDPTEFPLHIINRVDKNRNHAASLAELKTAFKRSAAKLFAQPSPAELRKLQQGPPKPKPR